MRALRNFKRMLVGFAGALMVIIGAGSAAFAADAFYDIPLLDLKATSSNTPKAEVEASAVMIYSPLTGALAPRAVLDGEGEVYIGVENAGQFSTSVTGSNDPRMCHLYIRVPQAKDLTGELYLAKENASGMNSFKFTIPAAAAKNDARNKFYEAKMAHYFQMTQLPVAGQAWFRYERDNTEQMLNKLDPDRRKSNQRIPPDFAFRDREDAYDLFSGGRAISESLQLDRAMRNPAHDQKPDSDIDSLEGITVAAIDWKPLLKDAKPALDPLSKLIPFDQHVLFIPSFQASVQLQDEMNRSDTLLLNLSEPKSEDLGIAARYQSQLGLKLTDLGRIVGPAAIKSLAVTGSDPYYPTGTDVAVLFETEHPDVLAGLLKAQLQLSIAKLPDAKPQSGEAGGLKYQGARSPDRQICSYIAPLNGAVVVTNSLAQLERLAKVGKEIEPISSLDEFKFFRRAIH